jgi:hypothetical protein
MQVYGNVATQPTRKTSKTTGKGYFEFRLCESQRGVDTDPAWYTVRVMKPDNPQFDVGNFVKVTGKLKADFYLSRDGDPTGTLLIIAFEASKIAKAVDAANAVVLPTIAPNIAPTVAAPTGIAFWELVPTT